MGDTPRKPLQLECWTRRSWISAFLLFSLFATQALAQSDPGTAVEGCVGCHALGEPVPVGNINHPADVHYVDPNPAGPASPSGYRQWNIDIQEVDVSGVDTVVAFRVTDENGQPVLNVFDTDGSLVIAELVDGVVPGDPNTAGDPTNWQRLVDEDFDEGVDFAPLGNGDYLFIASFDPTSVPIEAGDTLRAAIQLSASDIPAGNAWCDFEADLALPNDCDSPPALTRDIVQTDTCNRCHGPTPDTHLAFHRYGGRTEVEYCVTCHNPNRNPETSMTLMIHKIHYGSQLTFGDEYRDGDFAHVNFTRDVDDCMACHAQGGVDQNNWRTKPNREACGSCHDDVNFDTGENHGSGGQQLTNRFCSNCHPATGQWTASQLPVSAVHLGGARAAEAALYRGGSNGLSVDSAVFDRVNETVTVHFSATRDGVKMNLATDPRWSNGARLSLVLAWSTEDYTNEGSDSGPAPAQPISLNALDIGNTITDLGGGNYEAVLDVSDYGFGTATVALDGHPVAILDPMTGYDSVPVVAPYRHVSLEAREPTRARRHVVDIAKCNGCHDSGGAGLSFHGTNRTGESQVCVLCHNPDATDLRRRPADPGSTVDGKREESVDFKRLIHQIHMGGDLEEPVVVYGFGNTAHDYAHVSFLGNMRNCLTCHEPGTYGAEDAWATLPTTIDTGADVNDPSDDLNIAPITSVCSSCHDTQRAKDHMLLYGGSFQALDVHIALPEPGAVGQSLAALAALGLLVGLRGRAHTRGRADVGTPHERRRVVRGS